MNKPNVVLIFADDLGYGDVSCFNENSKIRTRNIDRLAKEGMRFEDSHATSALCTPSRYGLLTGRYNWRSRLKQFVLPGDSEALIEKDRDTIAHMFKENGYTTAAIGKWHLGLDWTLKDEKDYESFSLRRDRFEENEEQLGRHGHFDSQLPKVPIEGLDIDYSKPIQYGPLDYGFDYFFGTAASLDQPPYVYIENDQILGDPKVLAGLPKLDRAGPSQNEAWQLGPYAPEYEVRKTPSIMQRKVLDVLDEFTEEKHNQPFFLYYPTHLVHGPLFPDDAFKGLSGIGKYGDFVLQLDHYVGEIIDKLKKEDIFDETVFIFTSDNGASNIIDFEDLEEKGHHPSYHFRGKKSHIWEGGHREPTIISYPPLVEPGSVSNHMLSHSDMYRTLADLIHYKVNDEAAEDSFSAVSVLEGEKDSVRKDIIHSAGDGGFSIRRDFWKLNIVRGGGGFDDSFDVEKEGEERESQALHKFEPAELFDLKNDISEQNNVIDEYPELVEELTKSLASYIRKGRSTKGEPQENYKPHHWEQIQWMDNYEDQLQEDIAQKD